MNANLTALRAFYYDVLLLTTAYLACAVRFFLGQFPNMELLLLLLSLYSLLNSLYFPGWWNITLFLTGCLCALNYMSKPDHLISLYISILAIATDIWPNIQIKRESANSSSPCRLQIRTKDLMFQSPQLQPHNQGISKWSYYSTLTMPQWLCLWPIMTREWISFYNFLVSHLDPKLIMWMIYWLPPYQQDQNKNEVVIVLLC